MAVPILRRPVIRHARSVECGSRSVAGLRGCARIGSDYRGQRHDIRAHGRAAGAENRAHALMAEPCLGTAIAPSTFPLGLSPPLAHQIDREDDHNRRDDEDPSIHARTAQCILADGTDAINIAAAIVTFTLSKCLCWCSPPETTSRPA